MTRVAAVVLAAGEGSRFGGPKQVLLLPTVVARVRESGLAPIVVVEGAHALDEVDLGDPTRGDAVARVRCERWADGPGASLRCGLAALDEDVSAAVVILADGPRLAPAAIRRIVERWRERPTSVVAASYGGRRGHPLVVGRASWGDIPDAGLRLVEPELVPCDDLGDPGDVDRPGDLPAELREG